MGLLQFSVSSIASAIYLHYALYMRRVYLDYAGAAPVTKVARRAFECALRAYGNPSAPHAEGREAKVILEDARLQIARMAEVKPEAIIFTSGATEANALALQGVVVGKGTPEGSHVLYLPTSHTSVTETLTSLSRSGVSIEAIAMKDGIIDFPAFAAQLRPETLLVSVPAVESETGAYTDARDVRRALDRAGSKAFLHVDASQLPTAAPFERARLGADLIVLDAQKVGGVRGVGCLIAPAHVTLAPLVHGGGQERGLRSGSEPHALAAAFAAALKERAHVREAFRARATRMRSLLLEELARLEGAVENRAPEQVPHILNISLVGRDTDYLVALLDEAGYAVSTRSSCETDAEGSRVVRVMTGDEARAKATLRISWGPETREGDLRAFARALLKAVRFLDSSPVRSI